MSNSTGFQSIVGIDIAKSVFQVYSCDTDTGVITNEKIKRDKRQAAGAFYQRSAVPDRHGGLRQFPVLGP